MTYPGTIDIIHNGIILPAHSVTSGSLSDLEKTKEKPIH